MARQNPQSGVRKARDDSGPLTPDVLQAFLERATRLHSEGRFDEAARHYEHVLARNPEALAAAYFLALMDVETGNLTRALERLRLVVARDSRSFEGQYALGYVFEQLGQWPQAVNAYRRACELTPESTAARNGLAHALEVSGALEEAVAALRLLSTNPVARWQALARIAQIKPAAITAEDRAAMDTAICDPETGAASRIMLHFALGQLAERNGDYSTAFEAFAAGNRLKHAQITADAESPKAPAIIAPGARVRADPPARAAERHAAWIALAKRTFTAEFLRAQAGKGDDSRAPIFIVGMPRSGSTLIEQILSSHRRVQGLGETGALAQAVRGRWPLNANEAGRDDPEHFRTFAAAYLEQLRALGWSKTPFVIDKMLGNYVMIGLIHLVFPRATILHSVRDPVETCLACYRILFRSGNETTYDLREIGEHYVRYRETMAHWDAVLPDRVITVEHETLIQNPERQIRWLVEEACGLKWDEDCLNFHRTRRPVRTASVAQVRQPIFRSALERWRRYERHLGPLLTALGPYAPTV